MFGHSSKYRVVECMLYCLFASPCVLDARCPADCTPVVVRQSLYVEEDYYACYIVYTVFFSLPPFEGGPNETLGGSFSIPL